MDGTAPANGLYDLRFRVFDAAAGGGQSGVEVVVSPVGVTNGLFTVSLDFGDGVFTGAGRWLEMAARTNGSAGPWAVLDPRQPITAVPYALHAFSGPRDAGVLTTGTLPDARLSSNIARSLEVVAASNVLGSRLVASNAALQGQLAALSARLDQLVAVVNGLTNQGGASTPRNQVLASRSASDPGMAALGLVRFARLEGGGWRNGTGEDAPLARTEPHVAWTGNRLWVWGGRVNGQPVDSGALYDPVADAWSPLPSGNAPSARWGGASAWAGDRVVVWGGFGATYLGEGATFHPATMSWAPTPLVGAPSARSGQASAWTGARFVVLGGRNGAGLLADGAMLDVVSGQWTALPVAGAPEARRFATMTWAGDRLVVFGGEGVGGELAAGSALPLAGGTVPGAWRALSASNAPGPRVGHTAVWTGRHLIVWGGSRNNQALGDGALYDPATDVWRPVSGVGAPSPRSGHVAAWTGHEMVVSGGEDATGPLSTAAVYDPSTDVWTAVGESGVPVPRSRFGAAWTGDEWVVFGGRTSGGGAVGALQRLNPQAVWHLYRKP